VSHDVSAEVTTAESFSRARRWFMFVVLMLPYVFYAFLWNTENFLRPYIAESLSLTKTEVSAFYTLQALGALIGAIVLSQLADRFSRRNVYACVTIGFAIAAIGTGYVETYVEALLQRFAMGFFLGGVFGCAVSLYIGWFSPYQRGLLAGVVQLVYNGGDALLSWTGRHFDASSWRTVLELGGMGALIAGIAVFLFLPADRSYRTWGDADRSDAERSSKPDIRELFRHGRWTITIRLALLCGLNFFAFQTFNGWATTYLRETQGYDPDLIGKLMTSLHIGSMLGAIFWGLVGDRFGRRASALGFALSGVFVVLYLFLPPSPVMFAITGFVYGFGLVCTGIWGPYFAELYPENLRATAASIFGWGRIVSLFGALISGAIADSFGLQAAMLTGSVVFFMATLIWWSLPETLGANGHHNAKSDARGKG
jgi:MFS family permease